MAGDDFQHILRVLNTNVDGKQKVMYAITAIRGIGRRFSNLVCKKAEVDMRKRCARARRAVDMLLCGACGASMPPQLQLRCSTGRRPPHTAAGVRLAHAAATHASRDACRVRPWRLVHLSARLHAASARRW